MGGEGREGGKIGREGREEEGEVSIQLEGKATAKPVNWREN